MEALRKTSMQYELKSVQVMYANFHCKPSDINDRTAGNVNNYYSVHEHKCWLSSTSLLLSNIRVSTPRQFFFHRLYQFIELFNARFCSAMFLSRKQLNSWMETTQNSKLPLRSNLQCKLPAFCEVFRLRTGFPLTHFLHDCSYNQLQIQPQYASGPSSIKVRFNTDKTRLDAEQIYSCRQATDITNSI